jgi:hypothetical protein
MLQVLQPDLLLGEDRVTLGYEDWRRLVQRLAACPELPLYVTRCLAEHEERAVLSLDEVEAHPQSYGPHTLTLLPSWPPAMAWSGYDTRTSCSSCS